MAVLCTTAKAPLQNDWNELVKLVKFSQQTSDDVLTPSMGTVMSLELHIDVFFAVCPDCQSHSGLTGGFESDKGAKLGGLEKQKLNANNSPILELMRIHQILLKMSMQLCSWRHRDTR